MSTLTFSDKIPALTGGRDAILARAQALWAEKPPGDLKGKARGKYAVSVVLEAIHDCLRAPLVALVDVHVQAVEDEWVLMEGDAPADGDISPEALDWWTGLYEAQDASFAGDVVRLLGAEAVKKWVRSDDETSTLVDKILKKPIEDTARALSACGITQEDLASLASAGGDEGEAGNEGGESCEPSPASPGAAATAPEAAPAPAKATRRRAPPIAGPSPVTEAAKHLLEVVADHIKDQEVAEALEVSRAQVINYRRGTTLFAPSPEQLARLNALVDAAAARLKAAFSALHNAVEIAELE